MITLISYGQILKFNFMAPIHPENKMLETNNSNLVLKLTILLLEVVWHLVIF